MFSGICSHHRSTSNCKVSRAIAVILCISSNIAVGQTTEPPFTTYVERCIVPASELHGVNPHILRAILRIESNLNPAAVGKNGDGSADVGIGQMNSIHFKELSKFGIGPDQLKDACIGTYVAAWHLRKGMQQFGNTWEAIARYHSATPYFNNRYQILLKNELIRSGAIAGRLQAVPGLKPSYDSANTSAGSAGRLAQSESSRMASNSEIGVFDQSR